MTEWYPWYPSRYRADTMHLNCEEDGIYRRLIDHYMETRLPLPDDSQVLSRIASCGIDTIEKAMAKLRLLFSLSNGKLHLKKCDEILQDQNARSLKYSKNGKKGGRPKGIEKQPEKTNSLAKPKLQQSTRHNITIQDKDITPTPLEEKPKKTFLLPEWMKNGTVEAWEGWLEVRTKLKAPNTDRALALAIGALEKLKLQGHDPRLVLEQSTQRGWRGVFAIRPDFAQPAKPRYSESKKGVITL